MANGVHLHSTRACSAIWAFLGATNKYVRAVDTLAGMCTAATSPMLTLGVRIGADVQAGSKFFEVDAEVGVGTERRLNPPRLFACAPRGGEVEKGATAPTLCGYL